MRADYSMKVGEYWYDAACLAENHLDSSVYYIDGTYRAVVAVNGQTFYITDLRYIRNTHQGTLTLHNVNTGGKTRLYCGYREYQKFKKQMWYAGGTEIMRMECKQEAKVNGDDRAKTALCRKREVEAGHDKSDLACEILSNRLDGQESIYDDIRSHGMGITNPFKDGAKPNRD